MIRFTLQAAWKIAVVVHVVVAIAYYCTSLSGMV